MFAVIAPLIRLPRGRDWFDYAVPEDMAARPGQIVDIPFRKRTVKGVVIRTHTTTPSFQVRPIKKIITPIPFLPEVSLVLAQSIATQTATPLSVVLKSFLPVLKIRELTTLAFPEPKTNSSTPSNATRILLHWHDEHLRNAEYRHHTERAIASGKSVLIITAREPDIQTLADGMHGLPTATIPPDNRTHTLWEAWKRARSGEPVVLIGLRSGVFAPFHNLGLIIVDQEHDENLKQEEPNPRYHARSIAYELAIRSGADLILGSPVPSLESFSRTQRGILTHTEIGIESEPRIDVVNLENEHKKDIFSFIAPATLDAIAETFAEKKSTFILVDRLGAATKITCKDCQAEWKCIDCGAYLAYHGTEKTLRCQRCGHESPPPDYCPKCRGGNLKFGGAGTERISNLIASLKPDWPLVRLDSITAEIAPPKSLDLTKPAIIIGTRFALAHLNRAPLGLAISLTTDQLFARPEYTTNEDTYRRLRELARRAGHLIVYTRDPESAGIACLTKKYHAFYNDEARARERWKYPPFVSLTRLIAQNPSKTVLTRQTHALAKKLKQALGAITVSDPYDLQPSRVRGRWRMGILLKSQDAQSLMAIDWTRLIDADVFVDVQPNSIT